VPSSSASTSGAKALVAGGKPRAALELLKPAFRNNPSDPVLALELARTYLADNNPFWALNVLREHEAANPPACAARAMQAWIQIRQASFEQAQELLERPGCESTPQSRTRVLLIRAWMANVREDAASAERLLEEAEGSGAINEEDVALRDALRARFQPGRLPLASWKVDLSTGWTSNGLLGSPVDPSRAQGSHGSPLALADMRLRFVVPASRAIRPVADLSFKALALSSEQVSALSYRQPGARAGLLLGETFPRVLAGVQWDAVQLAGGDRYTPGGPLWFSQGTRGEVEIEASGSMYAFIAAGKRTFREAGRTRFELEQGLGASMPVAPGVRLLGGASGRWYSAENEAWDLFGGTLVVQGIYDLPKRWQARAGASIALDDYPRSKGWFDPEESRRDALLRLTSSAWTPPWKGARFGLQYEYARRWSSADLYAFSEHRAIGMVSWYYDDDRLLTPVKGGEGRAMLDYGLQSGASSRFEEEQRVRDMMRQDDTVRRGSSCMK